MAKVEYRACPFCGWTRPVKYGVKQKNEGGLREVRFDKVNPEKVKVIEIRELSHPKGQKAGKIETISYTLLKDLPDEFKKSIKKQCEKILKAIS